MKNLQNKINLEFKDLKLYDLAFTHRSFLNENKKIKEHNERLEFLGDAVLELSVTNFLFREFPKENEGKMTNLRSSLVKKETLADTAKDLLLGDYLKLSNGEEKNNGRNNSYILANTVESLIGAIYLDLGFGKADTFIKTFISSKLPEIIGNNQIIDSKSKLQSFIQAEIKATPNYKTIKDFGMDHDKTFIIGAYIGDCLIGIGKGSKKQNAEQEAAKNAYHKFFQK